MSVTSIIGSPIDHTKQVKEAQVGVAHTPGDLLEISGGKTQRHSAASGQTRKMFALENPSNGGTITDDYTADETGRYMVGRAGDRVYAFLANAVEVVLEVTNLISNGDGSLKVAAGTEDDSEIVGTSLETKTASGKTRCWVESA